MARKYQTLKNLKRQNRAPNLPFRRVNELPGDPVKPTLAATRTEAIHQTSTRSSLQESDTHASFQNGRQNWAMANSGLRVARELQAHLNPHSSQILSSFR
jgi:hypothetical protein